MKLYNPETQQIFNIGQLRAQYGVRNLSQARELGYFELEDKIENFSENDLMRPGAVVKSGDKYIRLIEYDPINDVGLASQENELEKLISIIKCLKSIVPTWNNITEYQPGQHVFYDDTVWLCNYTNTNDVPGTGNAVNYEVDPSWTNVF